MSFPARPAYFLWTGLWLIFGLSLSLRIYQFAEGHWLLYQHDLLLHLDRIIYTQAHWANPPLTADEEANQQPLYYWLAALFYQPGHVAPQDQTSLAGLGLCLSTASLSVSFLALRFFSSWWMRYIFMIYLGLTPAFVLASTVVCNDVLATLFGSCFFYFVLRLNRSPTARAYFWAALLFLFLGLFTKLSFLSLLAVLPFLVWRAAYAETSWRPTLIRLAIFSLGFFLWMELTIWHAWYAPKQIYVFYYQQTWPEQRIPSIDLTYIFTGKLSDLFAAAQTTTIPDTPDAVRFSFPIFFYGNMLLGEYRYIDFPALKLCAQAVLISGTILAFGLILSLPMALFGRPFRSRFRFNFLLKSALLALALGVFMQLRYLHNQPEVSGADFRYQFGLLPWIAVSIARGLLSFPRHALLKALTAFFMIVYAASSIALLLVSYALR